MENEQTPAPPQTPAAAPAPSPAQEVGASLRAARASRGFSLESVCQHTRIPRKYLEALEAGRFDDLPAPVYLRSFLGGYCEYLEIDMRPLWDKLHPAPSPAETAPAAPAPAGKPAGHGAPAPKAPAHAPAAATPLEASPYFNALVSALGAVSLSLALAAALVWWVSRSIAAPRAHAEEVQTPQALLPLRPATEPKLAVTCRDDAWLSVRTDGALVFAGRLPRGASHEFQAKKTLLLRAAVPENMDLTLNGAPYRLPRPDESGDYRIEAP
ncbi:MAG: DUF4115 domain-containing protein [Elusimicrobia bacterium]|nr:DUF4115 domain-containing protein [Elusimicrobiota bacterium]